MFYPSGLGIRLHNKGVVNSRYRAAISASVAFRKTSIIVRHVKSIYAAHSQTSSKWRQKSGKLFKSFGFEIGGCRCTWFKIHIIIVPGGIGVAETIMHTSIDITCPGCGEIAKFEEPFEFKSAEKVVPGESHQFVKWGGWFVKERFPTQFKWKDPLKTSRYHRGGDDDGLGGYPLLTFGLVQCSHCHVNRKHKLNWPDDAYWKWDIRGKLLWAWDRDHAKEILLYVKEGVRPTRSSYTLRYIPSHFLSAKMRKLVVQKVEKRLIANRNSCMCHYSKDRNLRDEME